MLILDEQKTKLGEAAAAMEEILKAANVTGLKAQLDELEEKTMEPDFWSNPEDSKAVLTKQSALKSRIADMERLSELNDDVETLIAIAEEADDEELMADIEAALRLFMATVEKERLATLFFGEYDANNAILTFHAGAGGTEAQDWAEMLYRMYNRYAAANGYKTTVLDYQDGDEAGLKSASILLEGRNAYGCLKSENGVHRLVRISPFDASGRRHTSFASLEVMPEISEDSQVNIRDDDLRVDTFRSSGAGGQHVNKTESAIRITHLPTGIVVSCQNQRSQHQNRDVAMKMLKSKLLQIKEQEHLERIEDIKGNQMEIGWGSQIRSYVFMPYTLVKDHRSGYEQGNVNAVMDGDLDGFIYAYLTMISKQRE
ncbi:MAG: peptide chain release factor 2 [Oscillospiraceae bacterium]|nr:peptide chain release factor 2 [Oscillospiraceae bacterium]